MWNKNEIKQTFDRLLKLFKFDNWNIKLEFVENDWKNTGNVKVDIEGKTAIVYLNIFNPKMENYEQVLVHELCHIIHFDHSKDFWNLVEKYYPEYKRIRKYLKE